MNRQPMVALFAGTLFGAGLAVSGMADPVRVRGFLDLFGNFDPTLAFVMGGALVVMAAAWRMRERLVQPVAAPDFVLPDTQALDGRLIAGAVIFGIGWGIAGLCPGPAIAALVIQPLPAAVFVAAMFAGMGLQRLVPGKLGPDSGSNGPK